MSFGLLFKVLLLFKRTGKGGEKPQTEDTEKGPSSDGGGESLHRLLTGQSRRPSGLRGVFSERSKDTCDELAVTCYYVHAQCSASQRAPVPLENCASG